MVLPTRFPGSSTVEHSAVNRRVASSNLARGANLRFFSHLNATRTFGPLPKGRWFKSGPRNQFVIHKAGILDSGLFRATAGGRFFWAKLLTPTVSLASSSTGTPFARACSREKTACARKSTRLVSLLLQLLQRYLQHLLFLVFRQLGEQERNL